MNCSAIDLSENKIIGKGQCSEVYEYDPDKVVKLFYGNIPEEEMLKEFNITSECAAEGLAAVRFYEFVTFEGRKGILMQRVNGMSVEQAVLKNPEGLKEYARKMALNLRDVHSKAVNNEKIPYSADFYKSCIEGCVKDKWISEDEGKKLYEFLGAIPAKDTLIHGDYHVLNMLIENGEIVMIDLADVQKGNPVFDLLIANLYLHFMPLNMKELYSCLIKISPEESLNMWEVFLRTYFETEDTARIERIKDVLDKYTMLKVILSPYSFSNIPMDKAPGFVEMARKIIMPCIDDYIGRIPGDILNIEK
ncbi:MAG: aminoglycoside phosphotransferase family protein [Eubacteriales bacterium]|nr:aminoglycoside phosphotransferase family protein [Eubacteriales bacterium]